MRLCYLLGAVKNHSKQIQQWILKDTMNIVPRRTNCPFTDEEKRDSVLQREMGNFMETVVGVAVMIYESENGHQR